MKISEIVKSNRIWFIVKYFAIFIAITVPAILLLTQGQLRSISAYWNTPMQPLFILSNALTSYHLYTTKKWIIPAIFLSLLTAFSVEYHQLTHDILAFSFFVSCLYPLFTTKRYKWCGWAFLISLPIFFRSIFYAEWYAIVVMCTYHSLILYDLFKIQIKYEDISKSNR